MSEGTLIGMLIMALGLHLALARVNRRLGTGQEYAPGGRMSALFIHIARAAAVAGWGALALGLLLDAVGVHALSSLLALIIVVTIPLAFVCLLLSLTLHLVRYSASSMPAAIIRWPCGMHRLVADAIGLLCTLLMVLIRLGARWVAKGLSALAKEPDHEREYTDNGFNYRTRKYDGGMDPAGLYHDDRYTYSQRKVM